MPQPNEQETKRDSKVDDLGTLLLEIGSMLMNSGASTRRVRITINRISEAFHYQSQLSITPSAINITLGGHGATQLFNSLKQTSAHGVNFRVVSGISRMSWRVVEEKWSLDQIKAEVERLASLPHYPRWMVVPLVGLACASFCRVFGGSIAEMAITFVAASLGLTVRQEAQKAKFNPLLCAFLASVTASMISGYFILRASGKAETFGASVLFLVPGVPLINAFIDLIDGDIQNSLVRGVYGLTILFAVALGFSLALITYGS